MQVHLFDGYWEDIGTIRSFFEANLELAAADRPFDLASANAPIYTRARFLPPSRFDGATVRDSLIADGCVIEDGAVIENSVIGLRCRIGRNVVIRNSVLMGVDDYETADEIGRRRAGGSRRWASATARSSKARSSTRTAASAATCGSSTSAGVETSEETPEAMIRDGIACVQKGAVLGDGWHF